jgi:hypothetical protein
MVYFERHTPYVCCFVGPGKATEVKCLLAVLKDGTGTLTAPPHPASEVISQQESIRS